jgi:hypothetical protein
MTPGCVILTINQQFRGAVSAKPHKSVIVKVAEPIPDLAFFILRKPATASRHCLPPTPISRWAFTAPVFVL